VVQLLKNLAEEEAENENKWLHDQVQQVKTQPFKVSSITV
jgi:hypothetical protein